MGVFGVQEGGGAAFLNPNSSSFTAHEWEQRFIAHDFYIS